MLTSRVNKKLQLTIRPGCTVFLSGCPNSEVTMAVVQLSQLCLSDLVSRQSILGEGGFGMVGLIPWDNGGTAVLKVMKDTCPQHTFNREKFFLKTLNGAGGAPHLLAECQEPRAMVITYQGSQNLYDVLKRCLLPGWYLCLITLEICLQLRNIHAAGVVHGDLHEANIILTIPHNDLRYRPQVKIIDYGLAAVHRGGLEQLTDYDYQQLSSHLGDNCVLAPESDLHALSMMLMDNFDKMEKVPLRLQELANMMRFAEPRPQWQLSNLDQTLKILRQVLEEEMLPLPVNWSSSTWCCPSPPPLSSSAPSIQNSSSPIYPLTSSLHPSVHCSTSSPRYPPSPVLPSNSRLAGNIIRFR